MKDLRGDSKHEKVRVLKKRCDAGEFSSAEMGRRISQLQSVTGVPKDLEYLEGVGARQYLYDMFMAQLYADLNRQTIAYEIGKALRVDYQEVVTSVHNFIDPDDMVIRKGAIKAYEGMTVAIPINRTEGTWICKVTIDDPLCNFSLPHGAGRTGSRTHAKSVTTQEMADKEMADAGIYSRYNPRDETDSSYKSPESILDAVRDRVEIVDVVKPIVNIK